MLVLVDHSCPGKNNFSSTIHLLFILITDDGVGEVGKCINLRITDSTIKEH